MVWFEFSFYSINKSGLRAGMEIGEADDRSADTARTGFGDASYKNRREMGTGRHGHLAHFELKAVVLICVTTGQPQCMLMLSG